MALVNTNLKTLLKKAKNMGIDVNTYLRVGLPEHKILKYPIFPLHNKLLN